MPSSDTDRGAQPSHTAKRRINLALQGGGSHGSFAWGVIDRLLEHEAIEIEGVVGTSAGAMNAAVMAYGLAIGGKAGARAKLREFWQAISEAARMSPLQQDPIQRFLNPGQASLDFSPGYVMLDALSRMFSPYQLNPMNLNPLRDVLASVIDFERLRHASAVKLFVCAANVMNGRLKVFERDEISVDAVLASACLPFMFQAVEIDGAHYWDGGYMGNPPIFPLIYNCTSQDVLIVQLNPINITKVPQTAQEILDRINTLSFNSSLMREMRAVAFVEELISSGFDFGGRLKRLFVHTIDGEDLLGSLGVSSKLNADWEFLTTLFNAGRARADAFLSQHLDALGARSSTDLRRKFL
jgi:NTE family protein